ncbi:MAG: hypothetical protein LH613_12660 [Chamaesiphon sp.]|nr:hypothetical protein [Chamaesiphon sp.]
MTIDRSDREFDRDVFFLSRSTSTIELSSLTDTLLRRYSDVEQFIN